MDFVNGEVPSTTHILGVNMAAGYFFQDPYLTPDMNRDTIVYLDQVAPDDATKLAWLRANGYTYVIYDRTVSLWSQQRDPDNLLTPLVPPFEAFLNHALILVRSLDGTDVYLVPPGGRMMAEIPPMLFTTLSFLVFFLAARAASIG